MIKIYMYSRGWKIFSILISIRSTVERNFSVGQLGKNWENIE